MHQELLQVLSKDPNARFIFLESDPIHSFLESNELVTNSETRFDIKHNAILENRDLIQGLFASYYEQYRRAVINFWQSHYRAHLKVLKLNFEYDDITMINADILSDFYHNKMEMIPMTVGNVPEYGIPLSTERQNSFDYLEQAREAIDRYIQI